MSKRKPTTSGTEWLYLSMASFNGSGYADKATPENYIASYRAYKTWRKEPEAVRLVDSNYETAFEYATQLCQAKINHDIEKSEIAEIKERITRLKA